MPFFTALAATQLWLTTALTSTLGATAAAAASNIIIGTTLSMISSKLFAPGVRTPPAPKYSSVFNQEVTPRHRGYGKMLLGGPRGEFRAKNGELMQLVMFHSGEIDSIEQIWAGDQVLTLDGSSWATNSPFQLADDQYVKARKRLGTADQTVIPELAANLPTYWTQADRFRGIAMVFGLFRSPEAQRISRVFPEGHATPLRALAFLTKVYDPRTGVTAWSRNPALCIRDYLVHRDGYRLDADLIDNASFAVMADVCDERVPLKSGGTQPRYSLGGVYSLQDDPKDVLGRMRATCDAELYETPEGKIAIRGGRWEIPTVTLTERDILSYDLQQGSDKFQTFNELKITYTSPSAKYQEEEATRWIDPADQARRGVISSPFNVDMVQSAAQARRLAKIYRAKENPPWTGSITTTLVGLRARYSRLIRIVIPTLGIDGPFLVENHGINSDLTGCALDVRWLGPEAYAWNPEAEEDEEAPETIDDDLDDIPVPADLVLTIEDRLMTAGVEPVVVATVTDPGRQDLALEAQLWRATRWEAMAVLSGAYEAVSDPVIPGETYNVRARFSGGDWSTEQAIVIPV